MKMLVFRIMAFIISMGSFFLLHIYFDLGLWPALILGILAYAVAQFFAESDSFFDNILGSVGLISIPVGITMMVKGNIALGVAVIIAVNAFGYIIDRIVRRVSGYITVKRCEREHPGFLSQMTPPSGSYCLKCRQPVSSNAKKGDCCPNCGVRWDYEVGKPN